jgi:hypothetical protein
VTIASGQIFTTTSGNLQIRLTQDVTVPQRLNGNNGSISASAEAVAIGTAGNITANSINTTLTTSGQVQVTNPAQFGGGTNSTISHIVTPNDLTGVENTLGGPLEQKALSAIDNTLQRGETRATAPQYSLNVTSNVPVGAATTSVQVTVTATATAVVYNQATALDLVRQLLYHEATQNLGSNYALVGGMSVNDPNVEQQNGSGLLVLNISASSNWIYKISAQQEDQWRQAIKGATPALAQSYLLLRPGVASAHITLPFNTDHLPSNTEQIIFVVVA